MESYPFIGRSHLNMVYFTSETDYAFRKLLFAVVPWEEVQSADKT